MLLSNRGRAIPKKKLEGKYSNFYYLYEKIGTIQDLQVGTLIVETSTKIIKKTTSLGSFTITR